MSLVLVSVAKQAELWRLDGNVAFKKYRLGAAIDAYTEYMELSLRKMSIDAETHDPGCDQSKRNPGTLEGVNNTLQCIFFRSEVGTQDQISSKAQLLECVSLSLYKKKYSEGHFC